MPVSTAPSYIELQSRSPVTRSYARRVREDGCPECGHDSLLVTDAMPATRIDPACWSGRCECAEYNRLMREGVVECPECGPTVSDVHDAGSTESCECECHCGCDFET